ncbi:GDP-L-fucose synthase family protein [Cellulomonas dongxiuzhuiae]|uniref:GDP-L-fucose synthase family protein n=1 Tax=Cellulomonas dongxiuzhuiae TaxID=2819979 RepID=UPI001AAE3F12|nr:GDP-L-fucose synthase [Cellulomonas dongxiuzhuiae]MBO3086695.1 GDP-L-fucose synthase [Cellulomonas dongxiuzhuiae]
MTRRIYLAGHRGLVGSALRRAVLRHGDDTVQGSERVDYRDRARTFAALAAAKPDVVVLAAGRVGGLGANLARPVEFLDENLLIQSNVLAASLAAGVRRLLFIGSANAYPADAPQPITEASLGTAALDEGTRSYGLAKLVGTTLCDAYHAEHGVTYHSVMPCNLYGPGDRFDLETAHVVAATLRRFGDAVTTGADEVVVWGSGNQRRQLLLADDLAEACLVLLGLERPPSVVNVGPRGDTSIRELAELAASVVGFRGAIAFDATKPEGVLRRELDTSRMHDLGWQPRHSLEDGMRSTWRWYVEQQRQAPVTETSA